jgi:hypothetical protein
MAKPVTWRTELCGNRFRQMVNPNGRWRPNLTFVEGAANDRSEPKVTDAAITTKVCSTPSKSRADDHSI